MKKYYWLHIDENEKEILEEALADYVVKLENAPRTNVIQLDQYADNTKAVARVLRMGIQGLPEDDAEEPISADS